jgi:phospholipid/cholesterol/gamma-HCH transport system substrate-binding protein
MTAVARSAVADAARARRMLALIGGIFAAVLVGIALLVLQSFSGAFGQYTVLHANLPSAGNAIGVNTPVQYLDVTVGMVASEGRPVSGGIVSVVLHIKPSKLNAIPASVRATVGPLSIFGNQSVQLEARPGGSGGHLHAGQTIEALTSGSTASLQSTLGDLDTVLNSIHPAELDTALTAAATGLHGEGQVLGATLNQASGYLALMLPYLATEENDFALLGPVADNVAASTPALLGILSNSIVTSQTITADQTQLQQVLAGGAALAAQSNQLLSTIQVPFEHLIADFGPLLADLSQSPTEIHDILTGLDAWSRAWTLAESHGPYLTLSSNVSVPNPADAVLASLGAPNTVSLFAQGVGTNLVNPPTYTAADCARVPAYCSTTTHAAPLLPAPNVRAVMPASEQQAALSGLFAGLDHGQSADSPSVVALILDPLLQGMASQP